MRILVDSNVLLRTAKPDDPAYQTALAALARLHAGNHDLAIVPQCAYEFYVASTRPIGQNGLGLIPAEALHDLADLQRLYQVLPDNPAIFELWKSLVDQHQVRGKPAHDARLVAAMQSHGVAGVLTFNGSDFQRYQPDIQVLDPIAFDARSAERKPDLVADRQFQLRFPVYLKPFGDIRRKRSPFCSVERSQFHPAIKYASHPPAFAPFEPAGDVLMELHDQVFLIPVR